MIGLLWAGLAFHLSEEKESALNGAKQNVGNLTRVFEEHVVRVVEEADKALLSLRARYSKNPEQFDIENAKVYLDDLILQIGVIGPDGILKSTTLPLAPDVRMDLSDQKHYNIHLDSNKDELYISRPVIGRTTGKTNIQLSRRLSNPDGSFGGVIVASIDQSSLSRFYNSIDIGKNGSVVVMGVDHVVRVSRGFKNIKPDGYFPVHFLFKKLQESPTGIFVTPGFVDGIGRVVAYRKIKSLPMIVAVGLAQHEVLANYFRDHRAYYTAAAVLTAGILIAILFGIWHKRRLLAAKDDIQRAQQALTQSQERYQLVESAVNDGIFDRNILTGEAYFSPRWKAILGYADDEPPNSASAYFDLIHPDDKSIIPEAQWAHLEENKPYVVEYRLRCKDGGYRWVQSRGKIFRDAANRPVRILGSMTDITERKQADASIEEARENLERAEAMARLGHYKFEFRSNALIWSEGVYRILGRSPASFVPTLNAVSDLVHPDDRPALEQYRSAVMAGLELPSMTVRFVKDDGDVVYVENWAKPLRSSDGSVAGMFGTIQDVTARKQGEALVEESRDNLARAERMALLGHIRFEQTTGEYTWSEGVYRIMGKTPNSFTPTLSKALELIHPDDRPALEQYRRDVMAGLDVPRQTLRAVKNDGEVIYIEFWSALVRAGDGSVTGMFGTIQDVTEQRKIIQERDRDREFLKQIINNVPVSIIVKNASDHQYILINQAGEKYFGISRDKIIGKTAQEVWPKNTADTIATHDEQLLKSDGYQFFDDHPVDTPGNGVRFVTSKRLVIRNDKRAPEYLLAVIEDVTERKRSQEALERANRDLIEMQYAIDQAVTVAHTDVQGNITYVNDKFCQISGYSREELLGNSHSMMNSGAHTKTFFRDMYQKIANSQVWRGEICNRHKNGSLYWVDTTIVPQLGSDGKPAGYMVIRSDITARKLAEEQISYMAGHDALTGVGNRAVLNEKLEEALARLRRRQETFAIFLLDLDGFKHVNDSLGHAAGDELLKELAGRLNSSLRETDILTRLGGDEFAIIQSGETNPREAAIALAVRVLEVVAKPFDLNGHNVTIGTSIGIAFAPEDGTDAGELLKKADLALYRVKFEGRNNFRFFDPEMSKGASARLQMLADMRMALTRKEFELFYQPVFDAKTRRPCGVEALVRWRHPVEGLMPPDRFIPLAEETGLMEPLGEWILEQACIDAASWPEHIKVAVNLSAVQFRSGKLFDVILCALVESGLPPEQLELEITESVLIQNAESYGVVIQQLKNIGVSIVLDDFGIGYSSLSYLTTFPFDKIKIDKSFTRGLTNNAGCAASVASVLTLARGLDMIVTAEGVETKQQYDLLCAAGVHQVQGYLFGLPCPMDELSFAVLEQKGQAVAVA